jgi:hypothetical protein
VFSNPTLVITSVPPSLGADKVNVPSALVCVAIEVPFTVTVAPEIGSLFGPVTLPLTVRWAKVKVEKKRRHAVKSKLRAVKCFGIAIS